MENYSLTKGSIAHVYGDTGIYDGIVKNPHVRYGRNAVSNFTLFMGETAAKTTPVDMPDLSNISSLSEDEFTAKMAELDNSLGACAKMREQIPVDIVRHYLPGKTSCTCVNKMALLGVAFEELQRNVYVTVEQFSEKIKALRGERYNARSIDINNDGKIDISEYATTLLAADMLSKDNPNGTTGLRLENLDGTMNNTGVQRVTEMFHQSKKTKSKQIFKGLQKLYDLKDAMIRFVSDKNNIA